MKQNQRLSICMAAALVAGMASTASAQWVINEFQSDTIGSPDSQYIELYNPTPDASVAGLTLVAVRISQARAVSSIDLSGAAVGNHYVIANADFNTAFPGVSDATLTNNIRTSYGQLLLVNTADLPGGFTADPTTGYVFNETEFTNGTTVIDNWFYGIGDALDDADILWFGTEVRFTDPSGAFGGQRFPDGSATFETPATVATAPALWGNATPGAANASPASVADWTMY